ncbi:glycosyltransferase family 4 protein [Cupriavidus sp. CuC1]|uniref:glycosyltransferase family 4 protein n=1 Tax=Cupriavidus sp. CuC1 TaxID=3373131 RepID=UPI0037D0E323
MNRLPAIGFLTGTLNAFAGAERMTAVIANALAEKGYPVYVISLWDEHSVFALHPAVTHVTVHAERPSFKRAYLSTVLGIRRLIKRLAIRELIEVDTMLTLFTQPATLGLNVRHTAWEHCHFDEDLGKPARRFARRLAARFAEQIVVLTERDRKRWIEALRPRCPVVCIPNPLPFPMPAHAAPRTGTTVLAVGRLVPAKGFDTLLRAWSLVAAQAPEWELMIVGEGEERAALEALREQLGLGASVRLPGAYSDVTLAYEQASIFCLSSRYEGFGLVLVEAMAFGLPIVSTNCETGPRELLAPDHDALLVPVDDSEALARALLGLIRDRNDTTRLGDGARQKALRFSQERIVEQWQGLMGQPPST